MSENLPNRYACRHRNRVVLELAPAFHEAGRTVVGYWVGWYLSPGGVGVSATDWGTYHRIPSRFNTERANALNWLAGWIAECRFHSLQSGRCDPGEIAEYFLMAQDDLGWSDPDDRTGSGELYDFALYAIANEPSITPERFVEMVLGYEKEAMELIHDPLIWRAIRRVAKALVAHKWLADDQVRQIIGADFDSIFEVGA
jgi:hypothetical protein